jgi:hypothetical protein
MWSKHSTVVGYFYSVHRASEALGWSFPWLFLYNKNDKKLNSVAFTVKAWIRNVLHRLTCWILGPLLVALPWKMEETLSHLKVIMEACLWSYTWSLVPSFSLYFVCNERSTASSATRDTTMFCLTTGPESTEPRTRTRDWNLWNHDLK